MGRDDRKQKKSKSRYAVLVLTILSFITTVASIYDLCMLYNIDSFHKYVNVAIGVLVFIILILIIKTKKRFSKKSKKVYKNKLLITFQVFYFLVTLVFAAVVSYVYIYLGSFNKEVITYSSSLVVMKNSEADDIKDVKNMNIAILNDKKSPEGYIIPKEVIKRYKLDKNNKIKKYDNYSSMVTDLYSEEIDAMFIATDYASSFSSIAGYENIADETKKIFTKEKKMTKRSVGNKNVSSGKKITEPFTILLLGVDSPEEGLSKNTIANGDSIILVTFNPKTLNATMLSIPRDSYVPIACWSDKAENKITHAAAYGTECMTQTIEEYFDVNIDYYAKINFKGLVHLVDAVGGIDVEVPKDLCTDDSSRGQQVCIKEGYQHLDGEGALVLARNRKQLAAGDLDRGQNQQLVIKALINKIKTIRNASQFLKILNAVSNNLDTNFTTSQILSFYNVALDIMSNDLAKDDSDIVNIQRLYLQGSGQMIYDKNMKMELWDYVPNEESRDDIIEAMKVNLGLLEYKAVKKFTFSINEEYEEKVIGYGPYNTTTKVSTNSNVVTVPNFVGMTKADAQALANRNGIKVSFSGTGVVSSQSIYSGNKIDKSTTVVLNLKEEETQQSNPKTDDNNSINIVVDDDKKTDTNTKDDSTTTDDKKTDDKKEETSTPDE